MKKTSETIIFFGSGPVAAASLKSLYENFQVEIVITKQAPPHHKGSVPVDELARELRLPIRFANNRQELDRLMTTLAFKSQCGIIVDYGVIVSQEVISLFKLGIINSHFSLLPEWRGADPITFAILSGQKETGVSLMVIVDRLDEGQLIAQEKLLIAPETSAPELTNQLVEKSNEMIKHYLLGYLKGQIKPYDQPPLQATYSRKLTKSDGVIDWHKPAVQLEREIRAFAEWPKSRARLAGKDIIVTKAHVEWRVESGEWRVEKPGKVFIDRRNELAVQTGTDILVIQKLKPAGKREMSAREFLAGNRL